jgi:hypothetical protein
VGGGTALLVWGLHDPRGLTVRQDPRRVELAGCCTDWMLGVTRIRDRKTPRGTPSPKWLDEHESTREAVELDGLDGQSGVCPTYDSFLFPLLTHVRPAEHFPHIQSSPLAPSSAVCYRSPQFMVPLS